MTERTKPQGHKKMARAAQGEKDGPAGKNAGLQRSKKTGPQAQVGLEPEGSSRGRDRFQGKGQIGGSLSGG